ncbi:hypothetical protein HPB49_002453 [Dermacentor silvarum]|uniref:Uncharacterized protein n=1 Tax=Dermacentor silvarum TaxID=543639 RepID=A0ACB8C113_DERSI|nr:hypothetical protein HPB49_002453 [Dermacentor silvarum]
MEPEGSPRKSSTSSPPAPRSSTPELRLAGQASLQIPGVHKLPHGRHRGEDTDDEGDVRRPSEGLSHRKPSPASQPQSPQPEPAVATATSPATSSTSRRKHKRVRNRKLHRSPSAAVMSTSADATGASTESGAKTAVEAGLANQQPAPAVVRTPDRADIPTMSTKASAGLARHQGMEELQAVDQARQRRTPLRETTNTLGHMSPGISGYLHLRTPSPSCPGTPPTVGGAKADLRRLMGSLDLTSPERPMASTPNRHDISPAPRTSPSEMIECPFALPPDVGSGFLLEPPVAASSSHAPLTEQRKFRLTRTRSLPDLRQEAAAPEFLRNRLILQTDDTVYLPFILRKEYVIRTKLRVSFSLLKPPVIKRSHSEGHVTEVTFLQQAYCGYWDETDTEMEESDWRVDEGCNFFDLCYFRCKCCKKHAGPMAAAR